MWKIFAMAVLFACVSIAAPAQDNNNKQNKGGGSTKSSSTSTSEAGSSSSLTFNGGSSTQFIQALPGSANSVIPGFVAPAGGWDFYRPLADIPLARLAAAKKNGKPQEVHGGFYGEVAANNDPVHLVNWWPYTPGYTDDDVLGEVIAISKPRRPLSDTVLWALAFGKEKTHSRRCVVRFRDVDEQVTSSHTIGIGVSASGVSQGGVGAGGAVGIGFGKSTTKLLGQWEVAVIFLNDGKPEVPKQESEASHDEKTAASAPAQPPPAPAPVTPPPSPQPATPPPAPVVAEMPKPCDALRSVLKSDFKDGEFVVHFDLDKSKIRDEDRPAIQKVAALLKEDKSCRVRPEGDTCTLGPPKHNADLGRDRGWALYEALIEAGGEEVRSQLVPPVSGTYDAPASGNYAASRSQKPTSEVTPKNRRARLLIDPEESGK